jgi:glycerophosphoryl diester phosphodiesterase
MMAERVWFQAHRGGGFEAPDNTMAAFKHGWSLGGIPELDIRLTADGHLICLHDDTLARTTDAPPELAGTPVIELSSEVIRRYDAGVKFSQKFRGERTPFVSEVLDVLADDPEKMVYADIKNYDTKIFPALLADFKRLVEERGVAERVIAAGCDYELNKRFHNEIPGLRSMQWIGCWSPDKMERAKSKITQFEELEKQRFAGLAQIQLHLELNDSGMEYDLDSEFLTGALAVVKKAGIDLEVFPFEFTDSSVFRLLDIGIRWFATDEPSRLCGIVKKWRGRPSQSNG